MATKFPPIPPELMKELERLWPDAMPTERDMTIEDFRFKQGELAVVRFLRRHFDAQNRTIFQGR